jgi:hypothetical protein
VLAKPYGSPYLATQLTERTDLNHMNNPVQIIMFSVFLTETLNSIFKILAVLLYLPCMPIIKEFTKRYKYIHILNILVLETRPPHRPSPGHFAENTLDHYKLSL